MVAVRTQRLSGSEGRVMSLKTQWDEVVNYFWPGSKAERLIDRIRRHDVELRERQSRILKRGVLIEALRDRVARAERDGRPTEALRAELAVQEARYDKQVAAFEQIRRQRRELREQSAAAAV